jgi:hypothetical protein
VLLVLAGTAHAEAPTKFGFRLGVGHVPLADRPLMTSGIALGVEHPVFGKLRMLAEYEWLWLADAPADVMSTSFMSMGHRTNLGFRRAFATKRIEIVKFYADVEAGGGLGLYDTADGGEVLPHGFVGLRGGYQLRMRNPSASRVFEVELNVRGIVVEHGIGIGGGLGFSWGD